MSTKAKPKPAAKTAMIQAPVMTTVNYFIHYVPEGEWKKAVAFFQDTIGLMLKVDTGQGWAEFKAGGITFALHGGKDLKPHATGLCFHVEDCDIAVEQLKARHVHGVTEPKKVSDEPDCGRCFSWKDPWGNTFEGYGK